MKPWMAVLIVIATLVGGIGLLLLADGPGTDARSSSAGGAMTTSNEKIETISHGSRVVIEDHLQAGRFTIVEFTADW